MARVESILSLERRDIESLWLAMYGRLNFASPRQQHTSTYLGILDGASAGEYLAIHEGVAAVGGHLLVPPSRLSSEILRTKELGEFRGIILADPDRDPPRSTPSVSINSTQGRTLEIVAQLYQHFIDRGTIHGARVACDDANAHSWFAATAELPINVIHNGTRDIDSAFQAQLSAEGQAGSYRKVLRTDMRCDIDSRTPVPRAHLSAAVAAALEFIAE